MTRAGGAAAGPGQNATVQNTRLGIHLMIGVSLVFAAQDGLSRHLASEYNVLMVIMVRYWFFAAFVVVLAARAAGGFGVCQRSCPPVSCGVSDFRGAGFVFGVEPDGSGGLPVSGFA